MEALLVFMKITENILLKLQCNPRVANVLFFAGQRPGSGIYENHLCGKEFQGNNWMVFQRFFSRASLTKQLK